MSLSRIKTFSICRHRLETLNFDGKVLSPDIGSFVNLFGQFSQPCVYTVCSKIDQRSSKKPPKSKKCFNSG